MLRAGVVALLAAGTLAGVGSPALANDPTVSVNEPSPSTLGPGQTTTLNYRVTNDFIIDDVSVDVSANGLTCSGDCNVPAREFTSNEQKSFTATLKAPASLAPGSSQAVTVTVTAHGQGRDDSKSVQLTLKGPAASQPQTVKSISGKVVNADTSKSVPDAFVALNDAQGHRYDTKTDDAGAFKFTSSASAPISPGEILLGAGKEGFKNNSTSTTVSAGQAKSGVRITLKSTASPTATPTGSATPTAEESTAEQQEAESDPATAEESIDAAAAGGDQSDSGGSGLFSWMLIILGGLLVALGVGAIVLLVIRRREEGGEDGADDPRPDPHGPRPTPGAQGVYRGGPDPTMAAGAAGMTAARNPTMAMRPGLAEAPTMMHQPVEPTMMHQPAEPTMMHQPIDDEYPDPYGAPPLRAPQPAAPPTAYGSAAPPAFGPTGRATASVSPQDPYSARDYPPPSAPGGPGGYGSSGYDEPTGRYNDNNGYGQQVPDDSYESGQYGRPGAGDGYGRPGAGGYQQPDAGYDRGAGYDSGYGPSAGTGYDNTAEPAGGYHGDSGAGYGQHGGYGNGYGQQPGYPPQGYPADPGGGYHEQPDYQQVPEQRGSGYEQSAPRGYDQGYYDDEAPGNHTDRGNRADRGEPTDRTKRGGRAAPRRRSLDWLDD